MTSLPMQEDPSQWKSFRVEETRFMAVSQCCPDRPYLEIRVPIEINVIRRIVFKLRSHDQGFSDAAPHHKGTYDHSFTWFEAGVMTPAGHDRVQRRRLQTNINASLEFREHTICWDYSTPDESLGSWLSAIQAGDLIQIVPKADYKAWANYIQGAEIELFGQELTLKTKPVTAKRSFDRSYRKLRGSKEIRLLALHSGSFESSISCSILYTSLGATDQTPYECISYCWGDPVDTKIIEVSFPIDDFAVASDKQMSDPQEMTVTGTLFMALKYLRRNDGQDLILWVDSICINQNDLGERAEQVALMTKIYTKAEKILVWLGSGDREVRKSISSARTIARRYEESSTDVISQTGIHGMHKPLDGYKHIIVSDFIFKQPWFTRTWVLQEVFNAKAVVVHYGEDVLPWSMILRIDACISHAMSGPNPRPWAVMPPVFAELTRYSSTDNEPTDEHALSASSGILDVLIKAADLDATDPRDKIFALLQFGSETHKVNAIPEIRPDYRKSVRQVFAEFTRWWIISHASLRILSAVHLSVGRTWQKMSFGETEPLVEERPSWSYWYSGKSRWARGTLGLLTGDLYHAAAETVPDIELIGLTPEPYVLRLKGFRLGVIGLIKPYPYYSRISKPTELDNVYDSIFDPSNQYAIWTAASPRKPHQSQLRARRGQIPADQTLQLKLDHIRTHLRYANKLHPHLECHSDSLFSTNNQQRGLCPHPAKTGDIIVVLLGGTVPYILRERTDCHAQAAGYEFVGECFLDGYMDGRAIREHADGTLKLEVFDLI